MAENWFWAASNDSPAGDRFVIADGKDDLWARVRREVAANERCAWNAIHPNGENAALADILDMMFTVVPTYRVNHNRFVFEAAKIPVFADFLKNAKADLGNYVSNSCFPDAVMPVEPYSSSATDKLGQIVSATLGIDPDWYEV